MKLNHYALNAPQGLNAGLNGWGWLRRALTAVSKFGGYVGMIADFAIAIGDEIAGGTDWKSSWNNPSQLPEDWEPSVSEEPILNAYLENSFKPFIAYVEQIFLNISLLKSYSAQLNEYNNLIQSYEFYKNYHLNNETQGLSQTAILAKIEPLNIFMRELSKKLNEIFNLDENTTVNKQSSSFKPGDNISFGTLSFSVNNSFTANYDEYIVKPVITINTPTGTVTQTATSQSSTVELPSANEKPIYETKPVMPSEESKSYLFGLINFTKKPISSTIILSGLTYLGYKMLKKK